jgi:hypothetical protein
MEEGREVSGRVGGRDRERISKLEGKERQLGGESCGYAVSQSNWQPYVFFECAETQFRCQRTGRNREREISDRPTDAKTELS